MTERSIAIICANFKSNIGDFAILESILRDVSRAFPAAPIHVYPHGFLSIDQARLAAFETACGVKYTIPGATYADTVRAPQILRSLRLWPLWQRRRIDCLATNAATDARKFSAYSAVFIVGGALWSGFPGGISMFGTLKAVHAHNEAIWGYPFSVDPKIMKLNLASDLSRYFSLVRGPLIVRDGISYSVLKRLGVPTALGADCVFSLAPVAATIKTATLRSEQILIALAPDRANYDQRLAQALGRLVKFRKRIKLMTTCETEDACFIRFVADDLNIPICAPLTWQDAVGEIKGSSLLISNRLHGLIFATLAGTPVLPVTSRNKSLAFAIDADLPVRLAEINDLNDEIIDQCLGQTSAVLERMQTYKNHCLDALRSPLGRSATSEGVAG